MGMIQTFGRRVSVALARRPRLLFGIQERWLNFGYRVLDLRMAGWVVRRPEWLRAKSRHEPTFLEPELGAAASVNAGLALRVITASRAVWANHQHSADLRNTIWGTLLQAQYAELRTLVENGNAAALARFQSTIFRTETVNGYTYGSTFDAWPHRWSYVPVQIELSVVQLAESLGLIRAECHEQGHVAFWRSLLTEAELMDRLEDYFGFRIEQPRFGDPKGILFGGRFLTRETCSHLHAAHRMRTAIDRKGMKAPLNIVEIGGGFGGTCFWLRKVLGDRVNRYAIVDLPEVGLVQAYFLGSMHPRELVLRDEQPAADASAIKLVPYFSLEQIDFTPDVLINQDSMPEMPQSEVERYLHWASEHLNGLFLSFNQEAYSPFGNVHQVCVPEVVKLFPRFKRLSRDSSWDRRGYVEEVYETT